MAYEKIGLHILGGFRGPLGHPPVVVLVNVDAAYYHQVRAEVGDACTIVVRWTDYEFLTPPEQYVGLQQQMRHPRTVFQGVNEPSVKTPAMGRAYAGWELGRMAVLHQHGLNAALFSASEGQFEDDVWPELRPAIDAMQEGDVVSQHCYWGVDPTNPWHAARWLVHPELRDVPLVVTETGRDRLDDPNLTEYERGYRGWRGHVKDRKSVV